MTQNIKLAFKNTLWFLVPSGTIFLVSIALNVYWGLSGVEARRLLIDSYYFLLFHNIPFFIASLVLFAFLRKGTSRTVSVLVSNGVAFGSWWLILYLSHFIIRLGDVGVGGLLIVYIAILVLIIFFVRSITARYELATDAGNAEISRSQIIANKLLAYGLTIFTAVAVVYLVASSFSGFNQ